MTNDNNGAAERLRDRKAQIREIALDELYVDNRFQRALNPNKVNKIKDGYHPQGIGYMLAGHVLGDRPANASTTARYAVIDGQTRWKALVDLREEFQAGQLVPEVAPTVNVEVFEELTSEEAALLFRLRNDQRPVKPAERDRIMVTERDPTMIQVVGQSADAGYIRVSRG